MFGSHSEDFKKSSKVNQTESGLISCHNQQIQESKEFSRSQKNDKDCEESTSQNCNLHSWAGQIQVTKQTHNQYYKNFFCILIDDPNNHFHRFSTLMNKYGQSLVQNNIQIRQYFDNSITLISASQTWQVLTFSVHIWYFAIRVDLIMLRSHQEFEDYVVKMGQAIGSGAWGNVYRFQNKYVMKQLPMRQFRNGSNQIKHYLKQYALSKLLSCLQIGPKIMRPLGFDVICRKNTLNFFIEQCESISSYANRMQFDNFLIEQTFKKIIIDLKYSLFNLHLLQIIHYDIKPQNVMYSQQFGKFVYIDFGLSEVKDFQQGFIETQHFKGTFNYCSQEMRELCFGLDDGALLDVYYNDSVCLHNTLCHFLDFLKILLSQQVDDGQFSHTWLRDEVSPSDQYRNIDCWYSNLNKQLIERNPNELQGSKTRNIGHYYKRQTSFRQVGSSYQKQQILISHDFLTFKNDINLMYLTTMRNTTMIRIFLRNQRKWLLSNLQTVLDVFYEIGINDMNKLFPSDVCLQVQDLLQYGISQNKYVKSNREVLSSNKNTFRIFQMNKNYKYERVQSVDCLRQFLLIQNPLVKIGKDDKKYSSLCFFLNYLKESLLKQFNEPDGLKEQLTQVKEMADYMKSYFPIAIQPFKEYEDNFGQLDYFVLKEIVKKVLVRIVTEEMKELDSAKISQMKKGIQMLLFIFKSIKILIEVLNIESEVSNTLQKIQMVIQKTCQLQIYNLKDKITHFIHHDLNNNQIETLFQHQRQIIDQIYQAFLYLYGNAFRQLLKTDISGSSLKTIQILGDFQSWIHELGESYGEINELLDRAEKKGLELNKRWRKGEDFSNLVLLWQITDHKKLNLLHSPSVQHMIIVFRVSANFILIKRQHLHSQPKLVHQYIKSTKKELKFMESKFSSFPKIFSQQKLFLSLQLWSTEFNALRNMDCLEQMIQSIKFYFETIKGKYDTFNQLNQGTQIQIAFRRQLYCAYRQLGLDKQARSEIKLLIKDLKHLSSKYQLAHKDESQTNLTQNSHDHKLNSAKVGKQTFITSEKLEFLFEQIVNLLQFFQCHQNEGLMLKKAHIDKINIKEFCELIMQKKVKITYCCPKEQSNTNKQQVETQFYDQINFNTNYFTLQVIINLSDSQQILSYCKEFAALLKASQKDLSLQQLQLFIILLYLIIGKTKYLLHYIQLNKLPMHSLVEKGTHLDCSDLSSISQKRDLFTTWVLFRHIDLLLECSAEFQRAQKHASDKNGKLQYLVQLRQQLNIESNNLIRQFIDHQNNAKLPLLYWKNLRNITKSQVNAIKSPQLNHLGSKSEFVNPKLISLTKYQSALSFIHTLKEQHNIQSIAQFLTVQFMTRSKQHLNFGLQLCFQIIQGLMMEIRNEFTISGNQRNEQVFLIVLISKILENNQKKQIYTKIDYHLFISICRLFQIVWQHLASNQALSRLLIRQKLTKTGQFLIRKFLIFGEYEKYVLFMDQLSSGVGKFGHESKLIRKAYWKCFVEESLVVFRQSQEISRKDGQELGATVGMGCSLIKNTHKLMKDYYWPIIRMKPESLQPFHSLIPFSIALLTIENIYLTNFQKDNHQATGSSAQISLSLYTLSIMYRKIIHSILYYSLSRICRMVQQQIISRTNYWRVARILHLCIGQRGFFVEPFRKADRKKRWIELQVRRRAKIGARKRFQLLVQEQNNLNTVKEQSKLNTVKYFQFQKQSNKKLQKWDCYS